MKKEKWIIPVVAGIGAAAITYKLLSDSSVTEMPVVEPFDKDKYMGTWNEIARLPNFIEKNITDLIEEYTLNPNGAIKVVTKAYNAKKGSWKEFTGKAKFAGAEDVGKLKVSYFGPFYLGYNVLDIDADYRYALVSGNSLNYLWILSRGRTVPEYIKEQFLSTAGRIGFAVEKLEWL